MDRLFDFFFKMRVLWDFLWDATEMWYNQIWIQDLDSYYCCNGQECCCQGNTWRQLHTNDGDDSEEHF